MKNGMLFTVLLLSASVLLSSARDAHGQVPDVSISVDLAKVADPKAKAALDELGKKQATVKEAVIGEMKVTTKTPKGEAITIGSAMVRRPNFLRGYEKLGNAAFMEFLYINDGQTYWLSSRLTPKSGQARPPFIARTDVAKVQQAGLPSWCIEQSAFYRNPLLIADPATLKLESESPEAWVFTADIGDFPGKAATTEKMTLSMTFSKADGLVRKLIMSPNVTVTFDKIRVNPQPPIQDTYFVFTLQPGFPVQDSTDSDIKALKGEK